MKFHIFFRYLVALLLSGLLVAVCLILYWAPLVTASSTNTGSISSASMPTWTVGILTALAAVFALIFGKVADLWVQQEVAELSRREMCAALHAEIAIKLEQQSESLARKFRDQTFDRLETDFLETMNPVDTKATAVTGDGPKFSVSTSPVPVSGSNLVLDAVKEKIFTLPASTVEPTVLYYTLDAMLDISIKATQQDEFYRAKPERRAVRWSHIYDLAVKAEEAGLAALNVLSVQAHFSKDASKSRSEAIALLKYNKNQIPPVFRKFIEDLDKAEPKDTDVSEPCQQADT